MRYCVNRAEERWEEKNPYALIWRDFQIILGWKKSNYRKLYNMLLYMTEEMRICLYTHIFAKTIWEK